MRCFVALWPQPETATALERLAASLQAEFPGSRRVRQKNLHLTLAFLGTTAPLYIGKVLQALDAIDAPSFDWHLNHVGTFRHARVAWVGGPRDARLETLAAAVRQQLDDLAVAYDRKAFVPHVTLLRNVCRQPLPLREITLPPWKISRPRLVASERDPAGAQVYRNLTDS